MVHFARIDSHLAFAFGQRIAVYFSELGDVVFVEVARDFDDRAAYMFGNSKFNVRAIEQFDLGTTVWTSFGILGGACDGAKGCLLDSAYLGLHTTLNFLNVGLIGGGELATDIEAVSAYDPQVEARAKSQPDLDL